jgi:hypothetical protein
VPGMLGGVFGAGVVGDVGLAEDLFEAIDFDDEGDLLGEATPCGYVEECGLSHELLSSVLGKRSRIVCLISVRIASFLRCTQPTILLTSVFQIVHTRLQAASHGLLRN